MRTSVGGEGLRVGGLSRDDGHGVAGDGEEELRIECSVDYTGEVRLAGVDWDDCSACLISFKMSTSVKILSGDLETQFLSHVIDTFYSFVCKFLLS